MLFLRSFFASCHKISSKIAFPGRQNLSAMLQKFANMLYGNEFKGGVEILLSPYREGNYAN